MIVVRKTEKGFVRISGNPTLKSLDGKTKAPLRTIMHESWTAEDRAEYGIYVAEGFEVPDGKVSAGSETFEETNGVVKQILTTKDPEVKEDVTDLQKAERFMNRSGLTLAQFKAVLDNL